MLQNCICSCFPGVFLEAEKFRVLIECLGSHFISASGYVKADICVKRLGSVPHSIPYRSQS